MRILEWLFENAPDIESPAPPVALTPPPQAPATPDTVETTMESPVDGVIVLEEVFTVIDYVDASGTSSRRRITLRKVAQGPNAPMLTAVCHERRALRTFRCDRIQCFIEPDGEVIKTDRFFRETLFVDLSMLQPEPGEKQEDLARKIRDNLRPTLSVLVAAARCDDEFHPEELEVIAQYVEDEILILSKRNPAFRDVRVETLDTLIALIRKMRPQRGSLPGYLEKIGEMKSDRVERFLAALKHVCRADGILTLSEELFLDEVERMTVTPTESG